MLKDIWLLIARRGEQGTVFGVGLGIRAGQGDRPAPWDEPAWPLGERGGGRSPHPTEHKEGREQLSCASPLSPGLDSDQCVQATILNSHCFIFGIPECEPGLMNLKL